MITPSDRLRQEPRRVAVRPVPHDAQTPAESPSSAEEDAYHRLKATLHQRVVGRLDLSQLGQLSAEVLRQEVGAVLADVAQSGDLPLNRREREKLVQELLDEILGLGPLEELLRDAAVSDILVNGFSTIFVERRGRLATTALRFRDNEHLMHTINRIVSRVGRRVDESTPMVDARLPDGSRVNAIIPPLAVDGPMLSIRRFGRTPIRMEDMIRLGSLTEAMALFLEACVKGRLNILISGGTGTGKTTMLNAMSSFIPAAERVVTIEDAAELQLQKPHVVRLETRPPNLEGKGEVVTRDLVRNSLRMRPDRIIVGEIRSAEVLDMLQAMNTGQGSMATVHANSPRDAINRMMTMIGMSGMAMSEPMMAGTISRALHLVLQLHRGCDGTRRLVGVSEITGTEGQVVQMQDIFVFEQRGIGADGQLVGEFLATGLRPRCTEQLERAGCSLEPALFSTARRR